MPSRTRASERQNTAKAELRWRQLCKIYLPITCRNSIWRVSRRRNDEDRVQGWKLHVSATILSACELLQKIGPYLRRRAVLFKGPQSLNALLKLNAAVTSEFSQIGKFITVYPQSDKAGVEIARILHGLTRRFKAPIVPYDERFRKGSCVYYRYGAFSGRLLKLRGKSCLAIRAPNGQVIADRREPGTAVPRWLVDPFRKGKSNGRCESVTPLETDYKRYQAIIQRGRGGVYRALDISSGRPSSCIIKEGRRHGETDWFGRDGYDLIKREAEFLRSVSRRVAIVPRLRRTFRANGSYYLVQNVIRGRSLQSIIAGEQPISRSRLFGYCNSMVQIVSDIHGAGWVWRDCKPDNFLCDKKNGLTAIDFERACQISAPDPLTLATRGYIRRNGGGTLEQIDLYALGTSLMQVIARRRSPEGVYKAFKRAARRYRLPSRLVAVIRRFRSSKCNGDALKVALAELTKLRYTRRGRGANKPNLANR